MFVRAAHESESKTLLDGTVHTLYLLAQVPHIFDNAYSCKLQTLLFVLLLFSLCRFLPPPCRPPFILGVCQHCLWVLLQGMDAVSCSRVRGVADHDGALPASHHGEVRHGRQTRKLTGDRTAFLLLHTVRGVVQSRTDRPRQRTLSRQAQSTSEQRLRTLVPSRQR